MLNVSVAVDPTGINAAFKTLKAKQIPFATALALTTVAKAVQVAEQAALPSVFDRPTPFTSKGIGMSPATKSKLVASVFVKPIQASYLALQETGGTRTPKKRALVTPVDAKRNAYGNLPRRALQTLKSRNDVFVGTVDGVGGVWQRGSPGKRGRGSKSKAGGKPPLKLLIAFDDQAKYRARFGFRPRAIATIKATIGPAFAAALAKAMATAR